MVPLGRVSEMKRYPIIFGLRDVVLGDGYLAGVAVDGRALLHEEDDGYVWVEGVNPGGVTGTGNSHTEALEDFRKNYRGALYDIALEASNFKAFRREVKEFFENTGDLPVRDWEEAVEDVRAGKITADWLSRRSAETRFGIRVAEFRKPAASKNEVEQGSALAA